MDTHNLTTERVKELLDYNPETGDFIWKVTPCNSIKAGSIAGSTNHDGYHRIKINRINYASHRLAWLYVHGQFPQGELDHINGIRNDNRIANLREISRIANVQQRKKSWGKSGYMGVYANHGKWRVAIQVDKKTITIGNFSCPKEASEAYIAAKAKYHVV
jgi:hypothetical protein